MKRKKGRRNRWGKYIVRLLLAAMAAVFIPGAVYGAEEEYAGEALSSSHRISAENTDASLYGSMKLSEAEVYVKTEPEAVSVNSANDVQDVMEEFKASEISIDGMIISENALRENNITIKFALDDQAAVTADKNNRNVQATVSISEPTILGGQVYSESTAVSQAAAIYLGETKEAEHIHKWNYTRQRTGVVLAACSETKGFCEAKTGILLTLDVKKESDYTQNPPDSHVKILANGQELDLDNLGISYQTTYYKDKNGEPGDRVLDKEKPLDAGTYHVEAAFGNDSDGASIIDTFTINKVVKTSGLTVQMKTYNYADNTAGPSLSKAAKTKTLVYYYYNGNAKEPCKQQNGLAKLDSKSLDAGVYYVSAQYTLTSNENYIYVTGKTKFQVKKGGRSGIKVNKIGPYDLKSKIPSPQLNKTLEKNAAITYYYSGKNKSANGTKWTKKKPAAGTWYLYAVIKGTGNYKKYVTPTQKFTVYADHKCGNMPKKLTGKVQSKTVRCSYCGKKVKVKLPPKTVSVEMGKSKTLKTKGSTFSLGNSARVGKSYFKITETGKITTKALPSYYSSMPSSVPIKVEACGKTYTMKVKLEIPAPKMVIQYTKINLKNEPGYKFRFYYIIPGADKIQVRLAAGQTEGIRNDLDKYISRPRSDADSYINLSEAFLKRLNNKITFRVTAYYGSKKSKTRIISVRT